MSNTRFHHLGLKRQKPHKTPVQTNTMIKNYALKKQQGDKGFYVEIFFEVALTNNFGSRLKVEYLADPKWEAMCKAGLLLFHDYFIRKIKGDLEIRVHEIRWMPIDTNNLLVLYACVEALSDSLGLPIKGLSFDSGSGLFTFPDRRSLL